MALGSTITFTSLLFTVYGLVILHDVKLVCSLPLSENLSKDAGDVYEIGVGIADVTGPSAQINFMGYAQLQQSGKGIHLRQFSRAFIIGDGKNRIVFVNVEAGMISQSIKTEVIELLKSQYGNLYTTENVCLSGTHTHSGPGGFFQYFLYNVPSFGYVKATFKALAYGIVESIKEAHNNIKHGKIFYTQGNLTDASANRSPMSYLNNPAEERQKYDYDTDKTMFLLNLKDMNNNSLGMINWFAVHGTSMNNTNHLISSDNKGYASLQFEKLYNPPEALLGKGPFVAAFAQSNEGDSSPNIDGAKCVDTGLPCDNLTSTCNGHNEQCIAFGPGNNMFESTRIIGQKQFDKANELFASATNPIHGPVQFIHQYINMSDQNLLYNNKNVKTCKAALGYSFAAGTTDGPGIFDFHQATTNGNQNPFWSTVVGVLAKPSKEMVECQNPKAILVPTGEMSLPYDWTAEIIPTQILKIGNLAIVAVPGEFTTMSGRRMRDAVYNALTSEGANVNGDLHVVIAGLCNVYTNYVTTYEEYQIQRYEGGSTLFGPHTLGAYINQYSTLATKLAKGESVDPGSNPPDLRSKQIVIIPDVPYETSPYGYRFGDVLVDANNEYTPGSIVNVSFVCGNPRNNLMTGSTFLTVEYRDPSNGNWKVIATDADWETKFLWEQSDAMMQQSMCSVEWYIGTKIQTGDYRISHQGFYKGLFVTHFYSGTSKVFKVNHGLDHQNYKLFMRHSKPWLFTHL